MLDTQLDIIHQAQAFLKQISVPHYSQICSPHMSASAGTHMRHVIDHYQALLQGLSTGYVDYNKRKRFSKSESCPAFAIDQWQDIRQGLLAIHEQQLEKEISVGSEIALETQRNIVVTSTLARELLFVSSHAIHHFSLLAIIRSLQGYDCPSNFGVAPATLTFSRQRA